MKDSNCQGVSEAEFLETLRVTLREALAFNREGALKAAGDGFTSGSFSRDSA